ncbi:MAG: response regulator [Candidatus Omnitrophica bacterium]|nr:response regulator [Candidatus Omnitrophota bacterium]
MNKLRVLLVDDEFDFLKVMSIRISSWDYNVVEASNSTRTLEVVKNMGADIIVLDYVMPDMDGITLLRKIREIDKEIPVIMFTAFPDIKSMEGSTELGVTCYTPKLGVYSEDQASLKSALHMAAEKLKK